MSRYAVPEQLHKCTRQHMGHGMVWCVHNTGSELRCMHVLVATASTYIAFSAASSVVWDVRELEYGTIDE